jgi:hypothetical protein
MKIDPRRSFIQLPQAGWNHISSQFMGLMPGGKSFIGKKPKAELLRIHLAPTISASPAGAVSRMLGTLGFRAEVSGMLNAAIPATLAGKQGFLESILKEFESKGGGGAFIHPLTEALVESRQGGLPVEKSAMETMEKPEVGLLQTVRV